MMTVNVSSQGPPNSDRAPNSDRPKPAQLFEIKKVAIENELNYVSYCTTHASDRTRPRHRRHMTLQEKYDAAFALLEAAVDVDKAGQGSIAAYEASITLPDFHCVGFSLIGPRLIHYTYGPNQMCSNTGGPGLV